LPVRTEWHPLTKTAKRIGSDIAVCTGGRKLIGGRLEGLKLLRSGTYAKPHPDLPPAEAKRLLGVTPDVEPAELVPLRYKYLAVELFSDGEITGGQLARYLRVDRLAARRMVGALTTSQDVTSDRGGVWIWNQSS
jgi:hypothetical protein